MLGFEKLEEANDFGAELIMPVENFRCLAQSHAGEEDELMSCSQGCPGLPGETTLVQEPPVDPAHA